MIKFQEQVPSIYTSASRDFQYLSWLINVVLNSVKHNVDDLYNLPNTKADPRLIELLAMTLGFKVKRNYNLQQLSALVAVLPIVLKYKGTVIAVEMAGKALVAASGATGDFVIENTTNGELLVILPETLVDISLFTDLLPYILPAGMTCHIQRTAQIKGNITTKVAYYDAMLVKMLPDLGWDGDAQVNIGLARLFSTGTEDISTLANFQNGDIDQFTAGLMNNTIIPSLTETLADPKTTQDEPDYTEEINEHGTSVIIYKYSTDNNNDGTTVIIGGN